MYVNVATCYFSSSVLMKKNATYKYSVKKMADAGVAWLVFGSASIIRFYNVPNAIVQNKH